MAKIKIANLEKFLPVQISAYNKENEQLRAELRKYNEKNLMKLIDDTLKERAKYRELSKELEVLKGEYRELIRECRELICN